jgi:hypothetical protein
MWTSGRRFKYQLQALLKKRRSELDTVIAEEAAAIQALDGLNKQRADIEHAIARAEEEMRAASRPGCAIDQEQFDLARKYLRQKREEFERKAKEVQKAEKVCEQLRRQKNAIRQGIKTLERHRETKRAEREVELRRSEQRGLDELWLLRRGSERARERS